MTKEAALAFIEYNVENNEEVFVQTSRTLFPPDIWLHIKEHDKRRCPNCHLEPSEISK